MHERLPTTTTAPARLVNGYDRVAALSEMTIRLTTPKSPIPAWADRVWKRPIGGSAVQGPDSYNRTKGHVRLAILSIGRVTPPGVELIAAPWSNKRPLADLVGDACEGLEPTDGLRVVCGHGGGGRRVAGGEQSSAHLA